MRGPGESLSLGDVEEEWPAHPPGHRLVRRRAARGVAGNAVKEAYKGGELLAVPLSLTNQPHLQAEPERNRLPSDAVVDCGSSSSGCLLKPGSEAEGRGGDVVR